ncbi:MAG TPA: RHS domain-containing protein, partial [Thermoanaerobaculia bacterium]|nr:RHS domain-containing protein [Thermoanaerobaculia bacterium]
TYSSEGRLYHWKRDLSIFQTFEGSSLTEPPLTAATAPSSFFTRGPVSTLYFGDRPIATIDQNGGFTQRTLYLTTDHLGTPILATDPSGSIVWQGGFEPFGKDWSGAGGAGVFLRFPGQWEDRVWELGPPLPAMRYNLYRWLGAETNRYMTADPLLPGDRSQPGYENFYVYGRSNSLLFIDPTGLSSSKKSICILEYTLSGSLVGGIAGAKLIGEGGLIVGALGGPGGSASFGAGGAVVGFAGGATLGGLAGYYLGSQACKECTDDDEGCPPCKLADGTIVPVGTVGYRYDRLPAEKIQHGIAGDHLNLYKANQNPFNCQCFWQKLGTIPPPPLPGWIPIQPFLR